MDVYLGFGTIALDFDGSDAEHYLHHSLWLDRGAVGLDVVPTGELVLVDRLGDAFGNLGLFLSGLVTVDFARRGFVGVCDFANFGDGGLDFPETGAIDATEFTVYSTTGDRHAGD